MTIAVWICTDVTTRYSYDTPPVPRAYVKVRVGEVPVVRSSQELVLLETSLQAVDAAACHEKSKPTTASCCDRRKYPVRLDGRQGSLRCMRLCMTDGYRSLVDSY